MGVQQARHHRAFSLADTGHLDRESFVIDTELLSLAEVTSDFGAVDNVLAGQAGDVRAGATDVFAFNHGYPASLLPKSPGRQFPSGPATENHYIIFFRADFFC